MKKIITALSSVFMFGCAQAQTYQPFTPPGGISTSTKIGSTSQTIQDITSLANGALQKSQISKPSGVPGLDNQSNLSANGYTNFDYQTINPSTEDGRLLVPEPTMRCYGTGGPISPTAQCLMVRATTEGEAVVGASVGLVNEDHSTDTSKNQVIQALGGLQDSANSSIWGQNIVLTQGPGTAGIIGQEIDMNRGAECDSWIDGWVNPGNCAGDTGVLVTGLQLSNRVGSPAFIVAPAPSATAPLFNVGYMTQGNVIRDTSFLDQTNTTVATLRMYNTHSFGTDCTNATFTKACLALRDEGSSGGQAISWFNLQSVFANANADVSANATITTTNGQTFISNYATGYVNINADSTKATNLVIGSNTTASESNIQFKSSGGDSNDAEITASGGTKGQSYTGTLTLNANTTNVTNALSVAGVADIFNSSGQLSISNHNTGYINFNSDVASQTTLSIGTTKGAYDSTLAFKSSGGSLEDATITASGGTAGESNTAQLSINASQVNINGLVKLPSMTKSAILGVPTPAEGMLAYDSDDHVPVIYENGAWYPLTLGTALQ